MPTPQSGLLAILNAAFGGKTFYVMLTTSLMTDLADITTAVAGEPSGNGYTRLPITFGAASATSDGYAMIVSSLAQFVISGGSIVFQSLVVVDVAAGEAGTVWSYYNYQSPITIEPGSSFSVEYPIKQSTS